MGKRNIFYSKSSNVIKVGFNISLQNRIPLHNGKVSPKKILEGNE